MPSSEYTVNILIKSKDQTSKPAKKATEGLKALKTVAKLAAGAFVALKIAQKGIDFVKFGARVDRAATALDNLAKDAGTSGDAIVKSIQEASGFTIDRMSAMEAANKALLLEVVKTPEEFAALTRNAVLLGRAMGEDAATSVDKFTRAAGRQSKLIADDLGLKIDLVKVQEETNRLMEADASLTEDAAKARGFFNVMMEEATRKTAALEGQQADAATQMEQLSAAWKTMTQNMGESTAEMIASTGIMGALAQELTVGAEAMVLLGNAAEKSGKDLGRGVGAAAKAVEKAIISSRTWQKDEDELRGEIIETTAAIVEQSNAVNNVTNFTNAQLHALGLFVESDAQIERGILSTIAALELEQQALIDQAQIIEDATVKQTNLAAAFMDATNAQIAQAAISELGALLEEDKITVEQYKEAVTETQLAFGLADEASIKLSENVLTLVERFGEGEVSASNFDDELLGLIERTETERLQVELFGDALANLPSSKTVDIFVNYHDDRAGIAAPTPTQSGLPSNVPQFASGGYTPGGSVMVGELGPERVRLPAGSHVTPASQTTNNYNFDQTVNTRATQHSIMNDWALAQALAP